MATRREKKGSSDTPDEPPTFPPTTPRRRRNRLQAAQAQRRITRGKLLRAGYRLFAERGKDVVSVNDITDAAGVGFGSFYNHFESKDAFHEALVAAFVEDIDARLDRRLARSVDVAQRIAITVRGAVERAGNDALWRRFLLREAFTGSFRTRGLEARLLDAIQRGLDTGRFRLLEPRVGSLATAGGLIGVVAGALSRSEEGEGAPLASRVRALGISTAATMLAALGLSAEEARSIAERPLRGASQAASVKGTLQSDRSLVFGAEITDRPDG
ncbi:MAG: TetR family transcriptional regulator [Panacagrimonas sp.]|nr:TetR/AcrR family transcriptional regulator [Panacagrimonas sp.]MCC2656914.1 TetR family transcriptional regulator [Panacagrimonas sp.]